MAASDLRTALTAAFDARPEPTRVPAASVAIRTGTAQHAWSSTGADNQYQAASISKAVAAFGALRLVAQGVLDLDADVNDALTSWRLRSATGAGPTVTLADLLSHGGATTVDGFPGYPIGAPLPTLRQILEGEPPANTAAVRVDGEPGRAFRYSGGGYQVVQQLLEDVTRTPFAPLMAYLVLGPAGMDTATYVAPAAAVPGHVNGAPVPGGWHVYPERAAAGLWCTPTDLLRFAGAVQSAIGGAPAALLPDPLAAAMVTPRVEGWGLGVALLDGARWFGHTGDNAGYRCALFATVDGDTAVAVMVNGDAAVPVLISLTRAACEAVGAAAPPLP